MLRRSRRSSLQSHGCAGPPRACAERAAGVGGELTNSSESARTPRWPLCAVKSCTVRSLTICGVVVGIRAKPTTARRERIDADKSCRMACLPLPGGLPADAPRILPNCPRLQRRAARGPPALVQVRPAGCACPRRRVSPQSRPVDACGGHRPAQQALALRPSTTPFDRLPLLRATPADLPVSRSDAEGALRCPAKRQHWRLGPDLERC